MGKGRDLPPAFQLFDPRKRFARICVSPRFRRNPPRIHIYPYDTLVPVRPAKAAAPPPDGLVNSVPLTRRLEALKLALDDLPRQARRLVLWQERRMAAPDLKFLSSLRPGRPPGYRRKPIHEVDEVLIECDDLAWEAMKPDTS
jgi:hypothetical protein